MTRHQRLEACTHASYK